MNSAQIHLALTHVPVILSLTGLVMLILSLIKRNSSLTRSSYFVLLFAGLFVIPVYFTGEGAEEVVEKLPGVSEAITERHEEMAKLSLISISLAGFTALVGLLLRQKPVTAKLIQSFVLLLAFTSGGLLAQTAHLGGQIRHTEIRSGSVVQNDNAGNENNNKTEADD